MNREVTLAMVDANMSQRFVRYDKNGEEHYNIASAFQKSIVSIWGDIHNSEGVMFKPPCIGWVEWLKGVRILCRVFEGLLSRFIARRLTVMASEEIGLADPQAFVLATACYQACREIGLPECNLALAECTAYLALASKSNEVTLAYSRVKQLIHEGENPPVPLHIRNAPIESMEALGYGVGYQYGYNKNQTYLPTQYLDKQFMDVGRAVMDIRSISMDRVKGKV